MPSADHRVSGPLKHPANQGVQAALPEIVIVEGSKPAAAKRALSSSARQVGRRGLSTIRTLYAPATCMLLGFTVTFANPETSDSSGLLWKPS